MREALCPGMKIGVFAFHRQLKLDLKMTGPGSLPLQLTNIKHFLPKSRCPRPDFYAWPVGVGGSKNKKRKQF